MDPPPYQQSVQDNHLGQAALHDNENTPLVPHRRHRKIKRRTCTPISSSILFLFLLLLVLVPLSALSGVCIYISVSKDILDPRVRDRIRHDWSIELEKHNQAIQRAQAEEHGWLEKRKKQNLEREAEEREWQEKQQRREREETAREKREKWERVRMRLYWDDIQGDEKCIAHGTRGYRARLANLLPGIDAIEACRATSITIRNVTYKSPDHCQDGGIFTSGPIYGHWIVKDEPLCSTFWYTFGDKGCTGSGSGLRRFESLLGGLRSQDDPLEMCFSTPASILGQHFERPTGCEYRFLYGYLSYWDVPDNNCS